MAKQKTHEQFLSDLLAVNPNVKTLEMYINCDTKILCECTVCGNKWKVTPSKLLCGRKCPVCSKKAGSQKRMMSHEEFVKRVQEANPNNEVIGTYTGTNNKVECRCKIHGTVRNVLAATLLSGSGCSKCAYTPRSTKRKTNSEFLEALHKSNKNVTPLEEYISSNAIMKVECKNCGEIWSAKTSYILRGIATCPNCKIGEHKVTRAKSHEDFLNDLQKVNCDIEVLDKYVNSHVKLLVRCKTCGNEWMAAPTKMLSGRKCPVCSRNHAKELVSLTHEEFVEKLKKANSNICVIGKYEKMNKHIRCKCLIDGFEWEAAPHHLLHDRGCLMCGATYGEKEIYKYLLSHNIPFTPQCRFDGLVGVKGFPLRVDFFINDKNLIIEYNGIQHYKPAKFPEYTEEDAMRSYEKIIEHDKRKREYAKTHGYKFLEIKYDCFDKIEEILDNALSA